MIITTTTNRIPAMMRIAVGFIDALSLECMRHGLGNGFCRIPQNWDPAFEPKERDKSTLKAAKQQEERQKLVDH
jgi:hypothetical protein